MKFSLIPKEVQFFDLMDRIANYMVEISTSLTDLVTHYENVEHKIRNIGGIEHACDEVCHTTLEKLETTFITPLDREDIHSLVLRMDDVVDQTNAAASRMHMFRIDRPRPAVIEFSRIIAEEARLVSDAVKGLRDPKRYTLVTSACIEVHRCENEADDLVDRAIGELFEKETNAIELIRWKEIYEALETVTDRGEDVANVVQGIVVKNA